MNINLVKEEEMKHPKEKTRRRLTLATYFEEDVPIERFSIPEHSCGVYILILESGKRYIGSSINIYRRIKKHMSHYNDDPIKMVNFYITKNMPAARRIESELIQSLKPNLNILSYYSKFKDRNYTFG